MALQPKNFTSQEMLQPGARGEMFVNNDFPGYRSKVTESIELITKWILVLMTY